MRDGGQVIGGQIKTPFGAGFDREILERKTEPDTERHVHQLDVDGRRKAERHESVDVLLAFFQVFNVLGILHRNDADVADSSVLLGVLGFDGGDLRVLLGVLGFDGGDLFIDLFDLVIDTFLEFSEEFIHLPFFVVKGGGEIIRLFQRVHRKFLLIDHYRAGDLLGPDLRIRIRHARGHLLFELGRGGLFAKIAAFLQGDLLFLREHGNHRENDREKNDKLLHDYPPWGSVDNIRGTLLDYVKRFSYIVRNFFLLGSKIKIFDRAMKKKILF